MTSVRVLADPDAETAVTRACFEATTTLGIRRQLVSRAVLRRQEEQFETDTGNFRVKIAQRPGGRTAKVESDDLEESATLSMRRARRQALESRTEGEDDE
ncbi:MAG: nickel insertion protein [Gammaproteobacteria bacterium]|nr:nickel insertion protein [Gammaproteobacteria bacterium]